MKVLDWNKINATEKKALKNKEIILGSKNITRIRIRELSKDENVIFGCFKDEFIDGLNGSNYKSLTSEKIEKYCINKNLKIIHFYTRDSINIIKDLKPKKVIMMNGSWSGPIHFRREYWACIDLKIPIQYISAISEDKKEIENFKQDQSILYDENIKYSEDELLELSKEVGSKSYCWQAQVGAIIAKNGKILATNHNRILPQEYFCLKNGCIRESLHLMPGQDTQICMANHAESEAIDYCVKNNIDIKDADIFLSLAPCPVCAKLVARSGIKRVFSAKHRQNDLAEEILKSSGLEFVIKT